MTTIQDNDQGPLGMAAAITVLQPKPGDVVIIRTTHAMGKQKAERMRRIVGDLLAGTGARAVVLPEVSSVEVVDEVLARDLIPTE
ncbi:MAG: hypothetical protein KKD97_16165 [Gammaproteobacteria bacterium]|nr:hypothetical protein [Gammaproteobacteria bacterium]